MEFFKKLADWWFIYAVKTIQTEFLEESQNKLEISEDLQNGEGKFSLPIFIKGLKMHFPRLYSSEVEIGFKLLYYTNLGE